MSCIPAQEFKVALIKASKTARIYALSLTRDKTRADDLVQDSLLRALENYERFEAGSNMEAWLNTILKRKFLDEQKSHGNSRTELMGDDGSYETTDSGTRQFDAKYLDQVNAYIDQQFSERDRSIFLMWVEGLSTDEMSNALGLSRSNVGVILFRIRKQIFKQFAEI